MTSLQTIIESWVNSPIGQVLSNSDFFMIEDDPLNYTSWRDKEDNIIDGDCNIYDPKYNSDFGANYYSAQIFHYKRADGTEVSSKITPLYCLCYDIDNDRYTNKDGIEVIKIEKSFPRLKIAETYADFDKLFNNLKKKYQPRSTDDRFKEELISIMNDYIKQYDQELLGLKRLEYIQEKNRLESFKGWLMHQEQETDKKSLFKGAARQWIQDVEGKYCPSQAWGDKTKIELASFIEIMFERGWLNGKDRVKVCKDFASRRYGVDLGSTLGMGRDKKASRATYAKRLKKHFDGTADT